VIGHFFAAIGLRPPLPLLRFVLSTLTIIAALLRFGGIVAALATKNDTVATKLLPYYPRYLLAADAMRTLQDMNLPIREGNVTTMVAVVSIDEPNWGVLLDFIKSETATRKSERTEALIQQPQSQSPSPVPSTAPVEASPTGPPTGSTPSGPTTPSRAPATPAVVSITAPPINFDRIKTIIAIRNAGVISAGPKALVPPLNLLVLWPGNVPRRVYEFLSFEEFRLDFRHMILDEIGELGLWLSALAFVCGFVLNTLRALAASAEQRELASQVAR
jgi:hypothetical protein